MDERLNKLHEMVNRGIDEIISKPSLDKETVCIAGELVDIRKDLATIEAMEEYGYSEGVYPAYYDGGQSYGQSYGNSYGNSMYARGGGRGRGRSSYGSYGSYGRPMMYNGGYSRGMDEKGDMMAQFEQAMANASNDHERETIQRLMSQMR